MPLDARYHTIITITGLAGRYGIALPVTGTGTLHERDTLARETHAAFELGWINLECKLCASVLSLVDLMPLDRSLPPRLHARLVTISPNDSGTPGVNRRVPLTAEPQVLGTYLRWFQDRGAGDNTSSALQGNGELPSRICILPTARLVFAPCWRRALPRCLDISRSCRLSCRRLRHAFLRGGLVAHS